MIGRTREQEAEIYARLEAELARARVSPDFPLIVAMARAVGGAPVTEAAVLWSAAMHGAARRAKAAKASAEQVVDAMAEAMCDCCAEINGRGYWRELWPRARADWRADAQIAYDAARALRRTERLAA